VAKSNRNRRFGRTEHNCPGIWSLYLFLFLLLFLGFRIPLDCFLRFLWGLGPKGGGIVLGATLIRFASCTTSSAQVLDPRPNQIPHHVLRSLTTTWPGLISRHRRRRSRHSSNPDSNPLHFIPCRSFQFCGLVYLYWSYVDSIFMFGQGNASDDGDE